MHRFGIVHFDWHGPVPPGPPQNPKKGPGSGGTVDLSSGLETYSRTDIALQGNRGALAIIRTYRTLSNEVGPFGLGADFNYNMRLDNVAPQTAATVSLIMQDGNRVPFARQPNGQLECKTDPHTVAAVMQTNNDGTATVTFKDGTIFAFEPGGFFLYGSVLVSVTDPNGNVTSINRNPASLNLIASITDPVGRALQFTYNSLNLVTRITDPIGRSVSYTYDASSNLTSVTDANGGIWKYQYDSQNRLIQTTDARGIVMYRNSYDSNGRVSQQITADASTQEFAYVVTNSLVPTSPVVQTTVTDQLGHRTIYRFNTSGYVVNVTDATGQTQTFARDAQTNLLLQVFGSAICAVCTDPATGGFRYTYDSAGNPTSETDGLGNTWVNTFDPITNQVLTRSDPLGNVTQFGYDGRGNIVLFKDQAGNTYHYTYDENGLLLSETDPSGAVAKNAYDAAGNLIAVTDALGNVTRYSYDAVSRQVGVQDPLGDTKTFTYDALDRMTSVTDANGRTIQLTFDPIGGLISITDAANHTTTYTRDIMDRITRRTDPLGRTAQYTYDAIGNMTSLSDRVGNTQSFGYDPVYRLVSETYSDASVSRTYDANNRLVQMNDSQAGAFTFSYDGVGRLLKTVTPLGAITFTRDKVGRVLNRTVSGQQQETLTYDAVGNITSASMGQASVQMSYDVRNLRTAINRSNGVKTTLTYDAGGRLVSRATANGGANLNTLNYTYDALGRRASISNDLGQPFATQTAAGGSYDASNELLSLGSTSYTNDANGNRLTANSSQGDTSYKWDGRGRLSAVTAAGQTTSLLYDPAGNLIRSQLTSGSGTTTRTYLLDSLGNIAYQGGSDATQQFSMLTGGTIDEYFAAVDSSGEAHFGLLGNLGAPVANSGSSGAVDGTASYEPFGQTSTTGSTYPIGYNGQIPISPNLYYFRTRFYDAVAGRFLSEDTAGFIGGWNLYEYGQNNPVNLSDPSGQYAGIDDGVAMAGGAIAGVVGQGIGDLLSGSSPAWEDYVGAAVGGAAAGEATLYSGPIIGGAAGGEVGNLVKQGLKNLTKKQCGFDPNSFLYDAVTGGLVGAIPGAEIPGISSGRNSWGAIAKSASTKVENGTISNVAAATYGKALGANLGEAIGQTISAGATGGVGNEAFPAPECK
jgi:RHS repeat-associated protein